MIRFVTLNDIPAWLELAKEVEPLFGKMAGNADFEHGIRHAILEKSVYGVENDHHSLKGIIALNRHENAIAWLAVRKLYVKYGFQGIRRAEKNPAGIETIIMKKSAATYDVSM